MAENKWVFTQLGGEKKTIELVGWAAPFGRPRDTEVVSDGIKIRANTVYYSGRDARPTRHIFGAQYDDIDLDGRWMDHYLGKGGAQALTDNMKAFCADQQDLLIIWGDTLSLRGFMTEFTPLRESTQEIAWEMTLEIDDDDNIEFEPVVPEPRTPEGLTNAIIDALTAPLDDALNIPPTIKGGILDAFNEIVSSIAEISSSLIKAAEDLQSFENQFIQQIGRFRATLRQFRQAITQFRDVYESLGADIALENQRSSDEIRMWKSQARFGRSMASALSDIVEADREAARAQRGFIQSLEVAQAGDSWESMAERVFGAGDRGDDIRAANGIPPGDHPVPGTEYIIPR